ncbi:exosome complex component MTR3-like [Lineus longissimus]|uniref:exosome complex component MTR3-like n=1 Tax=Lineus longissimus TaxID=88925 RepID=UPI002B4FAACE
MPIDSRRIFGPEETLDPMTFVTPEEKKLKKESEGNLLVDDLRNDRRKVDQIRPLFLQSGTITQAKGSAYIEINNTKVICAVYGPREAVRREDFSMKGQLNCEFKFATFSCPQRRPHQADMMDKDYSVLLMDALEPAVCLDKYPKSVVDVFVTVLENDGSALAAAITCAAVALADAEIEMYDVVIGCCLRSIDNHLLLDPTYEEEYKPHVQQARADNSMMTVAYMPSINQVSSIEMKGVAEIVNLQEGLKLVIRTCQRIYPVIQKCLLDAVKEKLKESS